MNPEPWGQFFKNARASLDRSIREREAKRESSFLLEKADVVEKHRRVHRAKLAREFLEGEFWREHLLPLFEEKQAMKPWIPGDPTTIEGIATQHMLYSGRAQFAALVVKEMDFWLRQGDEAAEKLSQDSKRRERVDELRR